MMTDREMGERRPAVTVVVPFLGDEAMAEAALAGLAALRLGPDDEVVIADNTPDGAMARAVAGSRPRVVLARDERSSYHARNIGAEHAGSEWLLFVDADCRPSPTLLDDLFAEPIRPSVGALAGDVLPAADQDGLPPRWARSRKILSQAQSMSLPCGSAAATANLLVRRVAWTAVGGFLEGVRSGEDFEFCWRLREAGWDVEFRPRATVEHIQRTNLREVVGQMSRYAAGNAWQDRRYPGCSPRPRLVPGLARSVAGMMGYAATGRLERAALKAIDGIAVAAQSVGYLRGNGVAVATAPRPVQPHGRALVVATDRFPAASETFIRSEIDGLVSRGWHVRVEALARPARPALGAARRRRVNYLEDEGVVDRATAFAWLLARHPVRSLADLRWRHGYHAEERMPLRAIAPFARRLARGRERRIHVHFAALAAVNALRVGRLLRVPVSIAPHGHEVFARPRRLEAKLAGAHLVAAPCDYTARHLRTLLGADGRDRVHTVVMGVDGERFRRRLPYPGDRTVAALGRLVEKKGFGHLVEATALLRERGTAVRVVIGGDGPLRGRLQTRLQELGLDGVVELPGVLEPDAVRNLLERADVFAMPCVIAADGDRDAMPVVVKEALAMEVPVVASDEVGLPEVVQPGWGRLVPPGDVEALASALEELLSLPPAERARMGRAGRAFVLDHCSVHREAAKLAELFAKAQRPC